MVEEIEVVILRTKLPTETLGTLNVLQGSKIIFTCKTMELPWLDNKNNLSCIPADEYELTKEATSPKHDYPHMRVSNVPKRKGILFHKITYVKDLLGCVGIGGKFFDINKDGVPDVIESGKTLQALYDILPDKCKLTIKWR